MTLSSTMRSGRSAASQSGYDPAHTAMMNNEMMRQLQARIQQMQDDLAKETVEASAGGGAVTVTVS